MYINQHGAYNLLIPLKQGKANTFAKSDSVNTGKIMWKRANAGLEDKHLIRYHSDVS